MSRNGFECPKSGPLKYSFITSLHCGSGGNLLNTLLKWAKYFFFQILSDGRGPGPLSSDKIWTKYFYFFEFSRAIEVARWMLIFGLELSEIPSKCVWNGQINDIKDSINGVHVHICFTKVSQSTMISIWWQTGLWFTNYRVRSTRRPAIFGHFQPMYHFFDHSNPYWL